MDTSNGGTYGGFIYYTYNASSVINLSITNSSVNIK